MYAEDSFFTLTVLGRVGLVCVSLILSGVTLAVLWRLANTRNLLVRLTIALVLFYLFVWLSPQFYYLYYIFLLEGLTWQWVIGLPPSLSDMVRLLLFQDNANLSYHSRGALGWLMMLFALLQPRLAQLLAR